MDPLNKLFKHSNGTAKLVRWFDFKVFNQRTEETLTKCDILHRRLNSMRVCENATRARPSDDAPAVSAAPAHIRVHPHSSNVITIPSA